MSKKFKAVLAVALAGFCSVSISVGVACAANTDNYIKANEGSVASEEKEVNHSMALAGNSVSSSDKVNGILFAAANDVTLKGSSTYNVVAGSNVDINGTTTQDLFAGGNVVNVNKDAKVERDTYLAGMTVNVKSDLNGNVFIAASTVKFSDVKIKGDLKIYAQSIIYDGNVEVGGAVDYNKNAQVTNKDKLKATAGVNTYDDQTATQSSPVSSSYGSTLTFTLLNAAGMLIAALIITAIFPGIYNKLLSFFKDMKAGKVVKDVLFGICALIATPIVCLLLLLTIVGIPFAVIAFVFYLICLYFTGALTGTFVGHLLFTKLFKVKTPNKYLELVIGTLLVTLLTLIPMVGWIFGLISVLLGFGLVIELIARRNKKAKK